MPSAIRALIWDFDGTLVDSPVAVQAATNAALAEMGVAAESLAAVRAGMVLPTIPRMAAHARIPADDPRAAHLGERFYVHARREFPRCARPFPGLDQVLRALAADGVAMGVVTNNLGDIARATLAQAGLAGLFRAVLGDGDTPAHKPDPRGAWMAAAACAVDPAVCAYVGDSAIDLATARAAGMTAIAVSWGTTARADLIGFDRLVDHPDAFRAAGCRPL